MEVVKGVDIDDGVWRSRGSRDVHIDRETGFAIAKVFRYLHNKTKEDGMPHKTDRTMSRNTMAQRTQRRVPEAPGDWTHEQVEWLRYKRGL